MTGARAALATAAETLAGAPFRLHGREIGSGLDCVGLVAAALVLIGRRVMPPRDYGLRNLDHRRFLPWFEAAGFYLAGDAVCAGDVLMVQPGPAQVHLLVAVREGGFIHAHAGLRRVVVSPGPLTWPQLGCWRLCQD